MSKASSIHGLNADKGLTKIGRVKWLLYNYVNNRIPMKNVDSKLAINNFKVKNLEQDWLKIDIMSSPARRLCDYFWLQLPWQQISNELDGNVRAIEIGCGSGRYGRLLSNCLGGSLRQYKGVDVKENADWDSYGSDPRFQFVVGDSASLDEVLQNVNFIITQSALEHFDEDLTFFRQVVDYVNSASTPVIQIHLMPSAGCLGTFLWHGVRHYTPRTLSKITRLFDEDTKKALYGLGSKYCNRVHRRYITFPLLTGKGDFRKSRSTEYQQKLKEAIVKDQQNKNRNETCFYALMLQSKVTKDIMLVEDSEVIS